MLKVGIVGMGVIGRRVADAVTRGISGTTLVGVSVRQPATAAGHPVLRWMASNVAVRQDPAGNIKIDKAKSTERVDGIVALAMAVGRAMVSQDDGYAGAFWV